jgi:Holliday junction resolvasome RuvABC endonuclease subunit
MKVLGVDPGSVSGAWAFIEDNLEPVVGDIPVADKMVDVSSLAVVIDRFRPDFAVVEAVHAFPGQGVSSSFRFGQGFGMILGCLGALGVPVQLVNPARWKKHYRLNRDGEASRALALRLYPTVRGLDLKRHHGRAEALLIARFGRGEGVA